MLPFCLIAVGLFAAPNLSAQSPQRLTALQDEPTVDLPRDLVARTLLSSRDLRLTVSSDARVRVLNESGGTQAIRVAADGAREVLDLVEGWYTVIAETSQSLAAIPVYVKLEPNDIEDELTVDDKTIEVPMIENGRQNARDVAELFLPPGGEAVTVSDERKPAAGPRHEYSVRLTTDGRLLGQVITRSPDGGSMQLAANNDLVLLRDGQRIGQSRSDARGQFQFPGIAPGVYGIVAAGPAGYTAFAFEAASSATAQISSDGKRFVARQAETEERLPVVMIPQSMTDEMVEELRESKCQQ